jgi:hypothetical protein
MQVLTIHQPAERLMMMSNNVVLLASGRMAFAGPTMNIVPYMNRLGFAVPRLTSSSEFLLDIVSTDFSHHSQVERIIDEWGKSTEQLSNMERISEVNRSSCLDQSPVPNTPYTTPFWYQLVILVKRGFLNTLRNPLVVWLRMTMCVRLAVEKSLCANGGVEVIICSMRTISHASCTPRRSIPC